MINNLCDKQPGSYLLLTIQPARYAYSTLITSRFPFYNLILDKQGFLLQDLQTRDRATLLYSVERYNKQ